MLVRAIHSIGAADSKLHLPGTLLEFEEAEALKLIASGAVTPAVIADPSALVPANKTTAEGPADLIIAPASQVETGTDNPIEHSDAGLLMEGEIEFDDDTPTDAATRRTKKRG